MIDLLFALTVQLPVTVTPPAGPVFDPTSMDKSVDPCEDFYTYSCGGWMKANPVPDDKSTWDAYGKLQEENGQLLRDILEEVKKGKSKIGDHYAACMDEAAAEQKGLTPLRPLLDKIDALKDKAALAPLLAELHHQGVDGALFQLGPQQDFRDATRWVAVVDQGGLGLPERDYYLKTDARAVALRDAYVTHVGSILGLGGVAQPKQAAATVLRLETRLAKGSMTNVARTDSKNLDHWMKVSALVAKAPGFDWAAYFKASQLDALGSLNVATPEFFSAMVLALKEEPLADWQTYLRWHVLSEHAAFLTRAFADEHFAFYGKTLRGQKAQEPRWKRCVKLVDHQLGELLGEAFVGKHFPPAAKAKTRDMVQRIQAAMAARLKDLAWMSDKTRQRALEKLGKMQNNIGYPDKWRDYSTLDIVKGDLIGNVERAAAFESKRELGKVGKSVEHGEWHMTPPTVNAYYEPQMNEMNFPAGVLLRPLFDVLGSAAANYGNTGATIGHELTHGFDRDGRQFDALGNLKDWWSGEDDARFKTRAQCIVDQYKGYVVIDDVHINSELTLGEDIADLGGTILAFQAWQSENDKAVDKSGTSLEQVFFIGYGQSFCHNSRDEEKRLRAATDVHSPAKFRINGVVANMPEFARAFQCKARSALVRKEPCRVW